MKKISCTTIIPIYCVLSFSAMTAWAAPSSETDETQEISKKRRLPSSSEQKEKPDLKEKGATAGEKVGKEAGCVAD